MRSPATSTTTLSYPQTPRTASQALSPHGVGSSERRVSEISAVWADDGPMARDLWFEDHYQPAQHPQQEGDPQDGFPDVSRDPRPEPPSHVQHARCDRHRARHRSSHRKDACRNIYKKFGATKRAEAVELAETAGLLPARDR